MDTTQTIPWVQGNVESVETYDFTQGYPYKLTFEV